MLVVDMEGEDDHSQTRREFSLSAEHKSSF